MEIWILRRHFEWQKWPRSMELSTYIGAVCKLTKTNKLTCMPRWRSEFAKCFSVNSSLPCHSKYSIRVSVHCSFGYVRYYIRSIARCVQLLLASWTALEWSGDEQRRLSHAIIYHLVLSPLHPTQEFWHWNSPPETRRGKIWAAISASK